MGLEPGGGRLVGIDESTELRWHPKVIIVVAIDVIFVSNCTYLMLVHDLLR